MIADSSGVEFQLDAGTEVGTKISPRDVRTLEDFLRRFAPRERRIGFRVPMGPLRAGVREQLQVRITVADRPVLVQPVDLSLTGMLVEVADITLPRGVEFPIELCFHELSCRLTGSLVRADGPLVALHFLESLAGGGLNPPDALLRLHRKLETEWLRSRL